MIPLIALMWSCAGDTNEVPAPGCGDGEVLDGETCVPAACGIGTWGELDAEVWVDGAAATGGDGSQDAPFQTVTAALAEGVIVGVAAGTYAEWLDLGSESEGVVVVGRCPDLVVIDASTQDDEPALLASGWLSDKWRVQGVTLSGGFPGVLLYDGRLTLRDVVIADSRVAGVLAGSDGASVTLEDVVIRDVLQESLGGTGPVGYGVDIEEEATLTATRLVVESAYGVGILATGEGTVLTLADVVVRGTRPGDSGAGYGLEVIRGASATATGLVLEGNSGAGALVTSDARADLGDLQVTGTLDSGADPAGLMVHSGARVTLAGASLRGNAGTALAVLDEGSSLEVTDSVVSGLDGARSKGLQVQWGGAAVLARVTLSDLGDRGIEVAGGILDASDTTVERATEVGLLAGLDGTVLALQDVVVRGTRALADGTRGGGVELIDSGVLTATGLTVQDNHGVGVMVSSDASATLERLVITGTHPEPSGLYGRGLAVQEGGLVDVSEGEISGNREAGVFVSSDAAATLSGVTVAGTGRSGVYASGAGVNVQDGATVVAADLVVTGTEGPGLYVDRATLSCQDCGLQDNGFAGAVLRSGSLALVDGTVTANPPDDGLGGGVGIYAVAADGPHELVLAGTQVSDHAYGAVYTDGAGSVVIDGAELAGGGGWELVEGRPLHGDAVFATGGIGPWDTETGLLVVGSTLRDSAGAGVFLDGASATLTDNTWTDNGLDLVQQDCGDDVAEVAGAAAVDTSELCPDTPRLVVPLSMQMLLQDTEASSF